MKKVACSRLFACQPQCCQMLDVSTLLLSFEVKVVLCLLLLRRLNGPCLATVAAALWAVFVRHA